ncbi:MAG TPA: hypothetical protein VEJ86_03645 [Candidatus Binataceae bacterium]|nr:hypothetical protein [Candidatus Binataceae bacterium]
MKSRTRIIIDGAIAGVIGGAVVALWFLVFDLTRGRPLETPALLAGTILHGLRDPHPHHSLLRLAAEYSMLHFAAFILVGIAAAILLEAAENEPPFLFSALIFFGAFEVFFIAVVLFLGPAVMAALTWWGIIIGNLLATGAMLGFFFSRHPTLARNLFGTWLKIAREGVLAGVVGGAVVAAWFLAYHLASGDIFRTPEMLGAMIFTGGAVPTSGPVSASLVIGYTVLHFVAFIGFGVAIAVMLAASEWEPLLTLAVFVLFAIFEVFFVGFVTLLDTSVVQVLGWWKIVAGNILALAAMTAYFMSGHRGLRLKLVERWATLETEGEQLGDAPRPPPHPTEDGQYRF